MKAAASFLLFGITLLVPAAAIIIPQDIGDGIFQYDPALSDGGRSTGWQQVGGPQPAAKPRRRATLLQREVSAGWITEASCSKNNAMDNARYEIANTQMKHALQVQPKVLPWELLKICEGDSCVWMFNNAEQGLEVDENLWNDLVSVGHDQCGDEQTFIITSPGFEWGWFTVGSEFWKSYQYSQVTEDFGVNTINCYEERGLTKGDVDEATKKMREFLAGKYVDRQWTGTPVRPHTSIASCAGGACVYLCNMDGGEGKELWNEFTAMSRRLSVDCGSATSSANLFTANQSRQWGRDNKGVDICPQLKQQTMSPE